MPEIVRAGPPEIAASKGHMQVVEVLLSKDADTAAEDNKEFTALAWAYSPTSMNVILFRVQRERSFDSSSTTSPNTPPLRPQISYETRILGNHGVLK